eukprot:639081-Rhodomonas_salina.3
MSLSCTSWYHRTRAQYRTSRSTIRRLTHPHRVARYPSSVANTKRYLSTALRVASYEARREVGE